MFKIWHLTNMSFISKTANISLIIDMLNKKMEKEEEKKNTKSNRKVQAQSIIPI